MKKIIIDYDNNFITWNLPFQQGTEYNDKINVLKVINSLGELQAEHYMELCKSGIFGMDFENEKITIFQPIIYDGSNGSMYPEHLLKVKKEIDFPGLKDKYNNVIAAMGYKEEDLSEEVDKIIKGIF